MKKLGDFSYIQIVDSHQIIIAPNGFLMNKDSTYSFVVSNLTNPNLNISSSSFLIQTFYSPDIYDKQIISQSLFQPPTIRVLNVRTCQFDLTIETKNQNFRSFYIMALICPSVIKEASRLQVYLPWNLTKSAKQICTSITSSLYSY